jgi:hypothetical protein
MGKNFSAWDVDGDEAHKRREQAETYYFIQAAGERDFRTLMHFGGGTIWKSIFVAIVLSGIRGFEVNDATCSNAAKFLVANWPQISGILTGVGSVMILMIGLKILVFIAFISVSDNFPSPHTFWEKTKRE